MKKPYCQRCKKVDVPLCINTRTLHKNGTERIGYMCRSCNTERAKKYRETKHGKERIYTAVYKSVKKHTKKTDARTALNLAVKRGEIKKPDICSACEKEKRVEAHHEDYNRPFDVVWLCRSCHADVHRCVTI